MVNVVVIMGRLVADPELRTTQSGVSLTRFTVAVDRDYVSKDQERQCDFIDVIAWRRTAEFVCKYFHKGSMIAITGSLQTGSYEDKNGVRRKSVEVSADSVSFTGSKSESGNGNYNNNYGGNNYNNNSYGNGNSYGNNNSYGNANQYGGNSYNNAPSYPAPSQSSSPAPAYSAGSDNAFQEIDADDDLPF